MSELLRVTVVADINDGDYIHKVTDIEESELDEYLPIIEKLKEHSFHNFEEVRKEVEESELAQLWEDFRYTLVPSMADYDVHTIESIDFCKAPIEEWSLL